MYFVMKMRCCVTVMHKRIFASKAFSKVSQLLCPVDSGTLEGTLENS